MQKSALKAKNIAILGAGIVGLSTADRLIELQVNAKISIISDKFLVDTVSDGAGGLFRPDDRFIPGVPKELTRYRRLKINQSSSQRLLSFLPLKKMGQRFLQILRSTLVQR